MFDDILLLADGQILFHGPREEVCFSVLTPKRHDMFQRHSLAQGTLVGMQDSLAPDLSAIARQHPVPWWAGAAVLRGHGLPAAGAQGRRRLPAGGHLPQGPGGKRS